METRALRFDLARTMSCLLYKSCDARYAHHVDQTGARIATNLRKGVLEYCVLALLARRDMYGLELADALVARGLTASQGSVYPLLARMRQAGLVETRWEAGHGARSRRYCAITEAGRTQLDVFAHVWQGIVTQVDQILGER